MILPQCFLFVIPLVLSILVQFQVCLVSIYSFLVLSIYIQRFNCSSALSYIKRHFEWSDRSNTVSYFQCSFQYSQCSSTNLHRVLLQSINTHFQASYSLSIHPSLFEYFGFLSLCHLRSIYFIFFSFNSYSIVQYFVYNISSGLVFFFFTFCLVFFRLQCLFVFLPYMASCRCQCKVTLPRSPKPIQGITL